MASPKAASSRCEVRIHEGAPEKLYWFHSSCPLKIESPGRGFELGAGNMCSVPGFSSPLWRGQVGESISATGAQKSEPVIESVFCRYRSQKPFYVVLVQEKSGRRVSTSMQQSWWVLPAWTSRRPWEKFDNCPRRGANQPLINIGGAFILPVSVTLSGCFGETTL